MQWFLFQFPVSCHILKETTVTAHVLFLVFPSLQSKAVPKQVMTNTEKPTQQQEAPAAVEKGRFQKTNAHSANDNGFTFFCHNQIFIYVSVNYRWCTYVYKNLHQGVHKDTSHGLLWIDLG